MIEWTLIIEIVAGTKRKAESAPLAVFTSADEIADDTMLMMGDTSALMEPTHGGASPGKETNLDDSGIGLSLHFEDGSKSLGSSVNSMNQQTGLSQDVDMGMDFTSA
jgi:hypothetical protein